MDSNITFFKFYNEPKLNIKKLQKEYNCKFALNIVNNEQSFFVVTFHLNIFEYFKPKKKIISICNVNYIE